MWAVSGAKLPREKAAPKIGSAVFVGPNSITTKGVTIGDRDHWRAFAGQQQHPTDVKALGQPTKVRGAIDPQKLD
jgi:hypothetical protein